MNDSMMSVATTILMRDPGDASTSRGMTDRIGVDMSKPNVPAKGRPLSDDDPRHGTSNGYTTYGCRCKDCCKAHTVYARRYAVKSAAAVRLWRLENAERVVASNRAYRAAHLDETQESNRVYRAAHADDAQEAIRVWRLENTEHRRKYAAAIATTRRTRWAAEDAYADVSLKRCPDCHMDLTRKAFGPAAGNADGLAAYCRSCSANRSQIRKAKKLDQFVERVDRAVVWGRDGGVCYLCGTPADLGAWHLDHIIPITRGGPHSYANTAVTHPACNLRKSANPWSGVVWEPPSKSGDYA